MPTPLPTLPGVYYAYVWMLNDGRRTGSTFTFKTAAGAGTTADAAFNAQVIADACCASWNTNMLPRYPSSVSGTDARVYPLQYPALPAALSHASAAGAGSPVRAAAPAAAVIRHAVVRRGRGSQSHTAISPLQRVEVMDDGVQVTPDFITNVTADFENFIAGVQATFTSLGIGGDLEYVQLSKKGAGATYAISGSVVEAILGTERSRTLRP